MILQDLVQYYEKNSQTLASFGFEYKEISFVILLSKKGKLLDIHDKRSHIEQGEKMLVPRAVKRSGTRTHPNYLWDNIKYVFGIGETKNQKQKTALKEKQISFLKNLKEHAPSLKEHKEIQAVICFLESNFLKALEAYPLWKEIVNLNCYLSFSIENTNRLVCQEPSIIEELSLLSENSEEKKAPCLLTGKKDPIARLHPFIQGVYGAQGSGASLISYNLPSTESFRKEQGYNAPISQTSAFAYSTALNHLLSSSQKMFFNEAMTLVFWSEPKSSFDAVFADFLKSSSKESLSSFLLRCLKNPEDSSSFFIHALSPNGARLSLRFSWTGSIEELKKQIKLHFEDLELTGTFNTQESFSFYSLLQAISPCRDVKYIQPRLAGEFLFRLLNGEPYPQNLLSILLEKIYDEEGISHRRASLIKAFLRRTSNPIQIQSSLDPLNRNSGYLLGRLFAVLEMTRKQIRGKKEPHATRNFYKTASIAPQKIFSYLLKRHQLHLLYLPTLYNEYFKTLKDSLLELITEFPLQLPLISQGEFAIGYYHQKQQIFLEIKKKQPTYDA